MKIARLLSLGLAIALFVFGGLAVARGAGWHLSFTSLDDAWTYPVFEASEPLDDYDISGESLHAGPPHKATMTLLSDKKIVLSLKQLHRGVCLRVQSEYADQLAQAPFRETALLGLFERQTPIEITLNRSKNEFNPFSMLVIMSNQTEDSVDPFVVQRPDVEEVFTLTARRECGKDATKPAFVWRVLEFIDRIVA